MIEEWRDVVGYEGLYKVSNLGRIYQFERTMVNNFGECVRKAKVKNLNPDKRGYVKVTLTNKEGVTISTTVHRVVCQAFLPNPTNLPMVNHKNGIKHDNRLENLEWCDDSHNSRHAIETGLTRIRKGEEIYFAKYSNYQVWLIKKMYHDDGLSITEITNMLGCNRRTIADMIKNRTWKHIDLNSFD